MLEEVKKQILDYKEKFGGDVPIFTANEVLDIINKMITVNKKVYDLKDDIVLEPSGNDLRDFIIRMQKNNK